MKFDPGELGMPIHPPDYWIVLYVSNNQKTAHTQIDKTTCPNPNQNNGKDMLPGLFIEIGREHAADAFLKVCLDPESKVRGNTPRSGLLELIAADMKLRQFNNFERIFKIPGAEKQLHRKPFRFHMPRNQ